MTLSNWRLNRGIARAASCLCLAVTLAACATQTESPPEPIPLPAAPQPPLAATPETTAKPSKTVNGGQHARPSKTLTTSYQGSDTAGQPTASGEPYNPKDLTAASRNLPMGSTVK